MRSAPQLNVEQVPLRIGEVARLAGVTTRTLRYWEQIGLVAPSGHLDSGQRLYSTVELGRAIRIRGLQVLLGLSLAEIRAVLDTDDVLDRLRNAYRQGARADRQRRLLADAIVASDRLIGRLDDTLGRIEEFRRERIAQGERGCAAARPSSRPEHHLPKRLRRPVQQGPPRIWRAAPLSLFEPG